MHKLKRIFEFLRFAAVLFAAKIVSLFAVSGAKYKDLWLVCERGTDARDNGYHFFKYLRQKHPEINAVYIISEDSPDRKKIEALGRVVLYRSFAHYLCYMAAKVRVSTHVEGYTPDFNKYGKYIPGKAINVFLQHGIIQDDIKFCHAENTKLNMFVCSALPEYEYIDKTYGYKEGVLQLTGLCRYDALHKNDKLTKKILFMPTWRVSLRDLSQNEFLLSDYYQKYNSLLNSERIADMLEKYDYELIFYPHYEIQKFIGCFSANNERVKIADFANNDVQQLLINSDILITDYSSVYFDYAYMRKPVIYYQYDENEYWAEQYDKGYFDCKRDGFGLVTENETELLTELEHLINNKAVPDPVYLQRMNSFFAFNDSNNCKRNFEAILRLM